MAQQEGVSLNPLAWATRGPSARQDNVMGGAACLGGSPTDDETAIDSTPPERTTILCGQRGNTRMKRWVLVAMRQLSELDKKHDRCSGAKCAPSLPTLTSQ